MRCGSSLMPNHIPINNLTIIPRTAINRRVNRMMFIRKSAAYNTTSSWHRSITILVEDWLVTNSSALSVVGIADIMRSGVCWEDIWLLDITGCGGFWLSLPELAAGGAGCVAVVWGWAEGFLFAVMTHEEDFCEGGEEEEDAGEILALIRCISVKLTYAPTTATAKQAVLSLQAVR